MARKKEPESMGQIPGYRENYVAHVSAPPHWQRMFKSLISDSCLLPPFACKPRHAALLHPFYSEELVFLPCFLWRKKTGEVWGQLFFSPWLTCKVSRGRTSLRKALLWMIGLLQIKGFSCLGHDVLAHFWACCWSRHCRASLKTLVYCPLRLVSDFPRGNKPLFLLL